MKKMILVALLLFLVGHPPRADASTTDTVTSNTTVTFVANPNLPEPSVPGGNGTPNVSPPTGVLPKTGESQLELLPYGILFILLSALLYLKKKSSKNVNNFSS